MKSLSLATLALFTTGCAATAGGPDPDGSMILAVSHKSGGGFSQQPTSKSLSSGPLQLWAGRAASGTLDMGDAMFEDQTFAEYWIYDAKAGELVTVEMISAGVDCYLMVLAEDAEGNLITIASDDDSAGNLDARLEVEFPAGGSYYVVANTAGAGQTGSYTLRVESMGELALPGVSDPDGRYALLVGAGDYPVGKNNDLEAVAEDLVQMRSVMIERYGFLPENVVVLEDARATRRNVIRGFEEHLSAAGSNGVAVFYFSGHGTQVGSNIDIGAGNDTEADGSDDAMYLADSSYLLDDEIGLLQSELDAGNTLAILDACHSGTGTMLAGDAVAKEVREEDLGGTLRPAQDALSKAAATTSSTGSSGAAPDPSTHVLLAASREIEVSWCAAPYQYTDAPVSVFTYNLARAMRETSDGATFGDVLRMAELGMAPWLENVGYEQIPQVLGTRSGESAAGFLGVRD